MNIKSNDSITRRSTRESIVRHTSYINDSAGKDCVRFKNRGAVEAMIDRFYRKNFKLLVEGMDCQA